MAWCLVKHKDKYPYPYNNWDSLQAVLRILAYAVAENAKGTER